MKKKFIISFVLALLLPMSLVSCFGKGHLPVSDSHIVDDRMEQLKTALNNGDKKQLKGMFSKQALSEAERFDENLEALFSLVDGEIISWERTTGPGTNENLDYGHITKTVYAYYTMDTSEQKYSVFILVHAVDTDTPDNVGLYALRVVRAEDKGKLMGYWQHMNIPGIYYPEEYRSTDKNPE